MWIYQHQILYFFFVVGLAQIVKDKLISKDLKLIICDLEVLKLLFDFCPLLWLQVLEFLRFGLCNVLVDEVVFELVFFDGEICSDNKFLKDFEGFVPVPSTNNEGESLISYEISPL